MRQTNLHTGLLADTNMTKALYSVTTSTSVTITKGIVRARVVASYNYGRVHVCL